MRWSKNSGAFYRVPRSIKHLREELAKLENQIDYPEGVERPKNRSECRNGYRPCPFVSCRYHLYLEVSENGSLLIVFNREPWELKHSCALDIVDTGGHTLEEVGSVLGVTRERIRQIEANSLRKLRNSAEGKKLADYLEYSYKPTARQKYSYYP